MATTQPGAWKPSMLVRSSDFSVTFRAGRIQAMKKVQKSKVQRAKIPLIDGLSACKLFNVECLGQWQNTKHQCTIPNHLTPAGSICKFPAKVP